MEDTVQAATIDKQKLMTEIEGIKNQCYRQAFELSKFIYERQLNDAYIDQILPLKIQNYVSRLIAPLCSDLNQLEQIKFNLNDKEVRPFISDMDELTQITKWVEEETDTLLKVREKRAEMNTKLFPSIGFNQLTLFKSLLDPQNKPAFDKNQLLNQLNREI